MVRTSRTQERQVVQVAEVLERPAVADARDPGPLVLGLAQERDGFLGCPLAQADRGFQQAAARPPRAGPGNSGSRPSLKNCWRACSARISLPERRGRRDRLGIAVAAIASRWLSARSRSPAKQSSSARNSRRPGSVGMLPDLLHRRREGLLELARMKQRRGRSRRSVPLRGMCVGRAGDCHGGRQRAGPRPVRSSASRVRHLIQLEVRPQVNDAAVGTRLVRLLADLDLASRSGIPGFHSGPARRRWPVM